jgi:hypothetical protein
MPHLCIHMSPAGNPRRKTPDPEHEPDFWKISKTFPLAVADADDMPSVVSEATMQQISSQPDSRSYSGVSKVTLYTGGALLSTTSCSAPRNQHVLPALHQTSVQLDKRQAKPAPFGNPKHLSPSSTKLALQTEDFSTFRQRFGSASSRSSSAVVAAAYLSTLYSNSHPHSEHEYISLNISKYEH